MVTRIRMLKKPKLKNPVLVTGLPGIGLVGKICVDYLLKQLKSERISTVVSDSFPPSVHTQNGVLELIQDEIYHCKISRKDFLFLAGPVQPALDAHTTSSGEHFEFADSILKSVEALGVKEVFTLAGINVGEARLTKEPRVIVSATHARLIEDFKKAGAIPSAQDGLISGAAGLLLGLAKEKNMQGACLMGETNASLVYGDHGAAKKVLEVLSKKFGWKIKMEAIDKESKNIEKAFTQLAQHLEEQQQAASDKPSSGGLTYVR